MANKHLSYKVFKRIFGDLGNTVRTVYNWTMGGPYNKITKLVEEAGYTVDAYVKPGLSNYLTKTINLWDEEWEVGTINYLGQNEASTTNIRSTNYIEINRLKLDSYLGSQTQNNMVVYFYDENKEQIIYTGPDAYANGYNGTNPTFDAPTGTKYVRFRLTATYGTTYLNDICISEYNVYLNGNYFPYFEGEKFLVLVGQYIFTGNESWDWVVSWGAFRCYAITNAKANSLNAIMKNYSIKPNYSTASNRQNMSFILNSNSHTPNTFALINNNYGENDLTAFKSYIAGKTINYQLATPMLVDIE